MRALIKAIEGLRNAPPVQEWLSIKEVAMLLGMSTASVRRRVADRTIPEPTPFGRLRKWKRIEIENL